MGGVYFEQILESLNLQKKRIFKIFDDTALMEEMKSVIDELMVQKNGYEAVAIAHAVKAFAIISRNEMQKPKNTLQHTMELAKAKIRNEYMEETSNEEYAKEFNMSVSHFIRLFKSFTGTTPQNYKLAVRISVAKNMLADTDYKIGDISQMIGFNDSMYFCKYFHKTVGCSPREFREKIRNQ